MRIFVTGASGWIGSAVVAELLASGHEVVALARSDRAAERVEAMGAGVRRGDLADPDGLAAAAARCEGVVHLAFQHDVAFERGDFAAAALTDRRAVEAMGAALAETEHPFVVASGVFGLAVGRPATEEDGLVPTALMLAHPARRRGATALLALSLSGIGVRSSIVRFAPTVHGDGDEGFVATLVAVARARGVSGYVGDGANRWPAVHRSDAARLVRLAVEDAPAGSVLHAVAEQGVALREVADVIGEQLGIPTQSVSLQDAATSFAHLGLLVAVDAPASSSITEALVGWVPSGPTLLDDLRAGHYFGAAPGPTS